MRFAVAGAAMLFACASAAATPQERAAYRAALKKAAADYNAAVAICRTVSGDARTICIVEAKADLRRAEAEAQARYRDTPRARLDASIAEANADYAVARAKCGTKSGPDRRACIRTARALQQDAITAAMRANR
jgi:hypothetical protein